MAFYSSSFPKDRICRIGHASELYNCLCNDMGHDPFKDVRATVRMSRVSRPTPDNIIVYKGILHFGEYSDFENAIDLILRDPKKLEIRGLRMGGGIGFTFESRGEKCKVEVCQIPLFMRSGIENAFRRHLAPSSGDNYGEKIHFISLKLFFERCYTGPPEEENSWTYKAPTPEVKGVIPPALHQDHKKLTCETIRSTPKTLPVEEKLGASKNIMIASANVDSKAITSQNVACETPKSAPETVALEKAITLPSEKVDNTAKPIARQNIENSTAPVSQCGMHTKDKVLATTAADTSMQKTIQIRRLKLYRGRVISVPCTVTVTSNYGCKAMKTATASNIVSKDVMTVKRKKKQKAKNTISRKIHRPTHMSMLEVYRIMSRVNAPNFNYGNLYKASKKAKSAHEITAVVATNEKGDHEITAVVAKSEASAQEITAAVTKNKGSAPEITAADAKNEKCAPEITTVVAKNQESAPEITAADAKNQESAPKITADSAKSKGSAPEITATVAKSKGSAPEITAAVAKKKKVPTATLR